MRIILLAVATALLAFNYAGAQEQAPGPQATNPEAQIDKARSCRRLAREQGLLPTQARVQAAVCIAEAQLECTKQAAETPNIGTRQLKEMVRDCMGRGGARKRKSQPDKS